MQRSRLVLIWPIVLGLAVSCFPARVQAAKLTVTLADAEGVAMVGAFQRWDQDGNLRKPVNKDAKIDSPEVDAKAIQEGNRWVFNDVQSGRYDLVIMAQGKVRIEGFEYAPCLEFDPFFPGDATCDDDAREYIDNHIRKSEHYENKVEPLYLGGDKKVVRILVQLIRDKPTSYTPGAGTMRHEIWQYTFNYGGWQKERRTKVIDRHILQVSELRKWTWIWDPKLGGIEVKSKPVAIHYTVPRNPDPAKLKGLYPY